MLRFSFLLAVLLFALPAQAESLRVTLLLASGQDSFDFTLNEPDSQEFRQRWAHLAPSENMVPLGAETGYRGVLLRGDNNAEFRLYNGVGRGQTQARDDRKKDDLRMLERWVLDHAPPPLGVSLVAALDEEVKNQTEDHPSASITQKTLSATTIINTCNTRAQGKQRLRALCLNEALLERLDATTYANALENLLKSPPSDPAPLQ